MSSAKYTFAQLVGEDISFVGASGKTYTCRPLALSGLLRVLRLVGKDKWDANPLDFENMAAFIWFSARRKEDGSGFVLAEDDLSPSERAAKKKANEEVFPSFERFCDEFRPLDFKDGGTGVELFLDVAELSGVMDPEAVRDLRTVSRKSRVMQSQALRETAERLTQSEPVSEPVTAEASQEKPVEVEKPASGEAAG